MYELTYIVNPNLSDEQIAAQTNKVRSFINELAGEVKNEKLWEKRRLAYPIKKQGYGFYVTAEFNIEPQNIIELDKKIKLEQNILRHLLITKEKIKSIIEEIKRSDFRATPSVHKCKYCDFNKICEFRII